MKLHVLLLVPILAFKGGRHHVGDYTMEPRTVGTLLDVTRSKEGQRHKIGGEFHDDRMNEMQQIKEALLAMLPQKSPSFGGEDFKFYIETVMHMVNVTMRASLDEQFQADKALAANAFGHFETCKKILAFRGPTLSWRVAVTGMRPIVASGSTKRHTRSVAMSRIKRRRSTMTA